MTDNFDQTSGTPAPPNTSGPQRLNPPAQAGRAGGRGKAAAGPKMADHIRLAETIRQHAANVRADQRQAVFDAWRTILLSDANLAAVRDLDKLGKIDQARWDVAVTFATWG